MEIDFSSHGRRHRRRRTAGVAKNRRPLNSRKEGAEFTNAIRHYLVEHARLGIPALMHEESLRGLTESGRFDLMVGPDSGHLQSAPLEVVAR
jgi:hypothetical protein